jgi:hypothetical protein
MSNPKIELVQILPEQEVGPPKIPEAESPPAAEALAEATDKARTVAAKAPAAPNLRINRLSGGVVSGPRVSYHAGPHAVNDTTRV